MIVRKINLLCSLSFDKMPINQSLSPVNLNSCLSQAFHFAQIHTLSLSFHRASCLFSSLPVSVFNGSSSDDYLPIPLFLTLTSCSSLFPHLPLSIFLSTGLPLSLLPPVCLSRPPSLSPSLTRPLCYVCCLAALSFTCQLGSGLWSSNMTNCPLIHTHTHLLFKPPRHLRTMPAT